MKNERTSKIWLISLSLFALFLFGCQKDETITPPATPPAVVTPTPQTPPSTQTSDMDEDDPENWTTYSTINDSVLKGLQDIRYLKNFVVEAVPNQNNKIGIALRSKSGNLAFTPSCTGGTQQCASSGLSIGIFPTLDQQPIEDKYLTSTKYPSIKMLDIDALPEQEKKYFDDDPVFKAQYFLFGKNKTYGIVVHEKDYAGDDEEVIDGVLNSIKERS